MTNMDAYKRTGRGGAGNFIPTTGHPVPGNEKDIEAQNEDASTSLPAEANTSSHGPVAGFSRAGRGGAGNFLDSSQAHEQERQEAEQTSAAAQVASKLKKHHPRGGAMALGGRGGAGNYSQQTDSQDEEERQREQDLHQQARDTVDKDLQRPQEAYHAKDH